MGLVDFKSWKAKLDLNPENNDLNTSLKSVLFC